MQLPAHSQRTRSRLTAVTAAAAILLALAGLTTPANAQTPWRFVVVGDTRSGDGATAINAEIVSELANEIVRQDARFVLVPGDLVYSGSLSAFQLWKTTMGPVYQAQIPVLPVIGNHDAADLAAWKQVFGADIPDNGPAGEEDRTYSFTHENVLVLALDNYVATGRVNQPWVDATLAANTLPHVFAFGHMPAFKANHTDCLDDYPANRDAFWNSLQNAGAGAYFAGHDHFYDHARIDDGDGNPDNDVHQLIVGSGGAPFTSSYAYNGLNTAWTPVNQYHEMQYGYSVVEISGLQVTMTFYHRTGAKAYAPVESWTYVVGARPVAVASSNVTSGTAPLAVQFTGSASHDADGSIVQHAWAFGDGSTSSLADPSHTYAASGVYTATLTVMDNAGLTDSSSITITVSEPPAVSTMHVGDLDASRSVNKRSWTAKVTIAVHASAHARVSGATLIGRWSTGAVVSCTTSTKGMC
jgi:PKD repeat protein